MENLYPAEPAILRCPTCGRTTIHDRRGCRRCRDEALDRLVDAVIGPSKHRPWVRGHIQSWLRVPTFECRWSSVGLRP